MVKQHTGFQTESVYVVGKNGNFRVGEPAKVIDLVWLTPENGERRLCIHIIFEDGVEDHYVYDLMAMDIVSETDVRNGNY